MDLGNLLQKYLNVPSGTPASDASSHFDQLGSFYAQHPQLVKTLGSAALTIALAKMANRMRA